MAVTIAKTADNKEELSLDYMVLSGMYARMGKPDSALLIQNLARRYAIESNYKIYMGYILRRFFVDLSFNKKDKTVWLLFIFDQ